MYEDNEISREEQLESSPSVKCTIESIDANDEALSMMRAEELNRLSIEASLPNGFKFDDEDWLTFQKEPTGNTPPTAIRICSRLEIAARTRDQVGENHGRLLNSFHYS
jgi:hypothetical protein